MLEQNVYQADLTARGILRLLQHERHFFAVRNPLLLILLLSPQVQVLPRICKFTIAQKTVSSLGHSFFFQMADQRALQNSQTFWFVFVTVSFSNFSKKRQRIASSSWRRISSNCLASLRCTLHSLKTLSQVFVLFEVVLFCFWFLLLRLASSSFGNVGNLSFALLLLKRL